MKQTTLIPLSKQILFFADSPFEDYPYRITTFEEQNKILNNPNTKLGIIDLGVYTYLVNNPSHTYPKELVEGMFNLSEQVDKNILIAYCYPATSDTCRKCNFKFCDNGHCGCNLTEEARYAVNTLYETYCEYCKKEVA